MSGRDNSLISHLLPWGQHFQSPRWCPCLIPVSSLRRWLRVLLSPQLSEREAKFRGKGLAQDHTDGPDVGENRSPPWLPCAECLVCAGWISRAQRLLSWVRSMGRMGGMPSLPASVGPLFPLGETQLTRLSCSSQHSTDSAAGWVGGCGASSCGVQLLMAPVPRGQWRPRAPIPSLRRFISFLDSTSSDACLSLLCVN